MISAKENNFIFFKFGKNETVDDFLEALQTYGIKSGFLYGFGKLNTIETGNRILEVEEVILQGVISNLKGKPHLELYCFSNQTQKIKNFVSQDLIIVVNEFRKIKLISILDEQGNFNLNISD